MKRLAKSLVKPIWRATGPLRRPFSTRLEAFLKGCLVVPPPEPSAELEEVVVGMDYVIRELVRLQDEVDHLRSAVEDRREAGLSVVAAPSDSELNRAG